MRYWPFHTCNPVWNFWMDGRIKARPYHRLLLCCNSSPYFLCVRKKTSRPSPHQWLVQCCWKYYCCDNNMLVAINKGSIPNAIAKQRASVGKLIADLCYFKNIGWQMKIYRRTPGVYNNISIFKKSSFF